jgi:hypothetical protein
MDPGVVMHTYNTSTKEAEEAGWQIGGQHGSHLYSSF